MLEDESTVRMARVHFVGSRNNDLEELASRARIHSRIDLRKQDGSRVVTKRCKHLQGLQ